MNPTPEQLARAKAFYTEYLALCDAHGCSVYNAYGQDEMIEIVGSAADIPTENLTTPEKASTIKT